MSRGAVVILTGASAGVGLDEVTTLLGTKAHAATVVDVRQGPSERIRYAPPLHGRVTHLRARPDLLGDLHPIYDHIAQGNTIIVVRPPLFDTFAVWLWECGGPEIFADLDLDLRAGVLAAFGRGHDDQARWRAQRLNRSLPVSRPPFVIRNDVHGVVPDTDLTQGLCDPTRRPQNDELFIPFPGHAVLQNAAQANIGLCEGAALGEGALETWPPTSAEGLLRWGRAVEAGLTPLIPRPWRAHASGSTRVVKPPSPEVKVRAQAGRRALKLNQLQRLLGDPEVAHAVWDALSVWVRHGVRRLRAYLRTRATARIPR
jgi:NAD(P)-dependent dehydrogenase (short-subunit alcohol dehydrogenase family)